MKISEAYESCRIDRIQMSGHSQGTFKRYGYCMAAFIKVIGKDKEIEDVTMEDIRNYYSNLSMNRCSNTIRGHMEILRQVMRHASIHGSQVISAELIPIPKREETQVAYVTPDEVQKMINSAQGIRNKLIISFLYASGVRISELIQLNRDSIKNNKFTVKGKGGKYRVCFIDKRTNSLLTKYLKTRDDRNPSLILSRQHNRISAGAIQNMIRDINKRSGITKRVTPHTFRHGFCTNLMNNGVLVQDAAIFMGHSHVNTTMIYYHHEDKKLRKIYNKNHTI